MSDFPQGGNTPYLLAIVVCDNVIIDERSKKKTLVGLFDSINSRAFPANHPALSIFVRVIDAEGLYSFRFDYVNVEDDTLINRAVIPDVTIPDRLIAHDLVMEVPGIGIPKPGEYEFRIFANERYIGRTKFRATLIS